MSQATPVLSFRLDLFADGTATVLPMATQPITCVASSPVAHPAAQPILPGVGRPTGSPTTEQLDPVASLASRSLDSMHVAHLLVAARLKNPADVLKRWPHGRIREVAIHALEQARLGKVKNPAGYILRALGGAWHVDGVDDLQQAPDLVTFILEAVQYTNPKLLSIRDNRVGAPLDGDRFADVAERDRAAADAYVKTFGTGGPTNA